MIKEYEGRTEMEAVARAAADLGLDQDQFDVEVVDTGSSGLFRRGKVTIRVNVSDDSFGETPLLDPENDTESALLTFLSGVIEKMGYPGEVSLVSRDGDKLILDIRSEHSSILIGRKGKNLDALQLLGNVYLNHHAPEGFAYRRLMIDAENYRERREEQLVKLALRAAGQVEKSRSSRLLEPMNPFERRLVHTALNEKDHVITKSEGDGLYKRVRIIYKGSGH